MAQVLTADEVVAAMAVLDGWTGDSSSIQRTVALPSFRIAIGVVDQVAAVAEELDHHPDIDIRWSTLTFACSTHSAGGVTDKDLTLARRIDEVITAAVME